MDNSPETKTRPSGSADTPSVETVEGVVCENTIKTASPTGSNNIASAEHCESGSQIGQTRPSSEEYIDLNKCGKLPFEICFSSSKMRYIFTSKDEVIVRIREKDMYKEMLVTDKNKELLPKGQLEEAEKSYKRYLDINEKIKDPIDRLSALLDCQRQ